MKKLLVCVLTMVFCLAPMAAMAEDAVNAEEIASNKVLALLSTPFDVTPEYIEETYGAKDVSVLQFPTYSEIVAALLAERADYAIEPLNTAQYLVGANSELDFVTILVNTSMTMLTRAEDEELMGKINEAIFQLSAIEQAQILLDSIDPDLDKGMTIDSIEILEGADTIRVGISGELPPMDYVDAQGQPRGYNVEYMSEIAKILGVNIEFVQIATDAKYAALQSGKIDVFFWHTTPVDIDEIKASDVYLEMTTALMFLK